MSKHTPGPWTAIGNKVFVDKLSCPTIASCQRSGTFEHLWPKGQPEANARLIAAAPDMAKTLGNVVRQIEAHYVDGVPEWVRQIAQDSLQALDKATGGEE